MKGKRIITLAVSVLLPVLCLAQAGGGGIRFLGIPVKGSRDAMYRELLDRGYRSNQTGALIGVFNGSDVSVYIGTDGAWVNRIAVHFPLENENEARSRYASLLKQFRRLPKYVEMPAENPPADDGLDAERRLAADGLSTTFFLTDEWNRARIRFQSWLDVRTPPIVQSLGHPDEDLEKKWKEIVEDAVTGAVRLQVFAAEGRYRVVLFYDSLDSMPDGSDL